MIITKLTILRVGLGVDAVLHRDIRLVDLLLAGGCGSSAFEDSSFWDQAFSFEDWLSWPLDLRIICPDVSYKPVYHYSKLSTKLYSLMQTKELFWYSSP